MHLVAQERDFAHLGLESQRVGIGRRVAAQALGQPLAAWVLPPPYAHWLERYRPSDIR